MPFLGKSSLKHLKKLTIIMQTMITAQRRGENGGLILVSETGISYFFPVVKSAIHLH